MSSAELKLMFVGDVIPRAPDPDAQFRKAVPVLQQADVCICHLEAPFTLRGHDACMDAGCFYTARDPELLRALKRAGFDIATMAHNHTFEAGPHGIEDALRVLHEEGLQTTGAGMTVGEARQPAIVDRDGWRVGVLQYNCVGPRSMYATELKAGCAYVDVLTHYDLDYASPGWIPKARTLVDADDLEAMRSDIEALRKQVDVLAVGFHKGLVHLSGLAHPLAAYERPLCRTAIDAGADVVMGNHHHFLRGVEVYRGKPIYHGLSNFAMGPGLTGGFGRPGTPPPGTDTRRQAWAARRRELFGELPKAEQKHAMIGVCRFNGDGLRSAGFVPCYQTEASEPEPWGGEGSGTQTVEYLADLSRAAGSEPAFVWSNGEVTFLDRAGVGSEELGEPAGR